MTNHRARATPVLVGVLLVVLGVGAIFLGRHQPVGLADPRGSTTSIPAAPGSIPRSEPVRLVVPSLGLRALVEPLGLQSDGEIAVPSNTVDTGWYDEGPSPGQTGSSVIVGHVDSYRGVGVFFSLRSLLAGSLVTVLLANGDDAHFRVTSVRTYEKNAFPSQLVYGNHGYAALNLVTCGGVFNRHTGHYESNVVVYSTFVGSSHSA